MKKYGQEGMALLTVLMVAVLLAGFASVIASRTLWDAKHTDSYIDLTMATEAADAGLEFAAAMLWGEYLDTNPAGDGTSGTLTDYRAFLDEILVDGETIDLLASPRTLAGASEVETLQVTREDADGGINFTIQSTGRSRGVRRTAVQQSRVGGSAFRGFEYALLANNINCIMCHADFDNVRRVMNTDPALYGTFDRVKVASLESMLLRTGSADSTIAGSFYTRGSIADKNGNLLPDLSGTSLTGWEFDDDGKLIQDVDGDMTPTALDLADIDPETGFYLPNEELYVDYPTDSAQMTDGELPTTFPPVIPDTNGNKVVDSFEFADFSSGSSPGSLWGGTVYGVANGDTYSDAQLPTTGNGASGDLAGSGQYAGNVLLVGTDSDPLQIDGKIFVDGDIVIRGPITGTGQLFAKGNIYFVGDTTYVDAPGKYGETTGGETNLVSYAAGGNVLVGDYLSTSKVDPTSADYLDPDTIDPGGPPNSGNKASFAMSEVTLFNKMEYNKWQAAPDTYVPRYYQLRDGDPIYRFDNDGKEHGKKYDESFAVVIPPADAAIVTLSPDNGWISEMFLKQAWSDDEASRNPSGQAFTIDGLIYTNNSVMALARKSTRAKGQLIVRGGMVAADIGILSPGSGGRGFTMLYDNRVSEYLGIEDVGNLTYMKRRRLFLR